MVSMASTAPTLPEACLLNRQQHWRVLGLAWRACFVNCSTMCKQLWKRKDLQEWLVQLRQQLLLTSLQVPFPLPMSAIPGYWHLWAHACTSRQRTISSMLMLNGDAWKAAERCESKQ